MPAYKSSQTNSSLENPKAHRLKESHGRMAGSIKNWFRIRTNTNAGQDNNGSNKLVPITDNADASRSRFIGKLDQSGSDDRAKRFDQNVAVGAKYGMQTLDASVREVKHLQSLAGPKRSNAAAYAHANEFDKHAELNVTDVRNGSYSMDRTSTNTTRCTLARNDYSVDNMILNSSGQTSLQSYASRNFSGDQNRASYQSNGDGNCTHNLSEQTPLSQPQQPQPHPQSQHSTMNHSGTSMRVRSGELSLGNMCASRRNSTVSNGSTSAGSAVNTIHKLDLYRRQLERDIEKVTEDKFFQTGEGDAGASYTTHRNTDTNTNGNDSIMNSEMDGFATGNDQSSGALSANAPFSIQTRGDVSSRVADNVQAGPVKVPLKSSKDSWGGASDPSNLKQSISRARAYTDPEVCVKLSGNPQEFSCVYHKGVGGSFTYKYKELILTESIATSTFVVSKIYRDRIGQKYAGGGWHPNVFREESHHNTDRKGSPMEFIAGSKNYIRACNTKEWCYSCVSLACLILANKFIQDQAYSNSSWSEWSEVPLVYLNKIEEEVLIAIGFDLHIYKEEFDAEAVLYLTSIGNPNSTLVFNVEDADINTDSSNSPERASAGALTVGTVPIEMDSEPTRRPRGKSAGHAGCISMATDASLHLNGTVSTSASPDLFTAGYDEKLLSYVPANEHYMTHCFQRSQSQRSGTGYDQGSSQTQNGDGLSPLEGEVDSHLNTRSHSVHSLPQPYNSYQLPYTQQQGHPPTQYTQVQRPCDVFDQANSRGGAMYFEPSSQGPPQKPVHYIDRRSHTTPTQGQFSRMANQGTKSSPYKNFTRANTHSALPNAHTINGRHAPAYGNRIIKTLSRGNSLSASSLSQINDPWNNTMKKSPDGMHHSAQHRGEYRHSVGYPGNDACHRTISTNSNSLCSLSTSLGDASQTSLKATNNSGTNTGIQDGTSLSTSMDCDRSSGTHTQAYSLGRPPVAPSAAKATLYQRCHSTDDAGRGAEKHSLESSSMVGVQVDGHGAAAGRASTVSLGSRKDYTGPNTGDVGPGLSDESMVGQGVSYGVYHRNSVSDTSLGSGSMKPSQELAGEVSASSTQTRGYEPQQQQQHPNYSQQNQQEQHYIQQQQQYIQQQQQRPKQHSSVGVPTRVTAPLRTKTSTSCTSSRTSLPKLLARNKIKQRKPLKDPKGNDEQARRKLQIQQLSQQQTQLQTHQLQQLCDSLAEGETTELEIRMFEQLQIQSQPNSLRVSRSSSLSNNRSKASIPSASSSASTSSGAFDMSLYSSSVEMDIQDAVGYGNCPEINVVNGDGAVHDCGGQKALGGLLKCVSDVLGRALNDYAPSQHDAVFTHVPDNGAIGTTSMSPPSAVSRHNNGQYTSAETNTTAQILGESGAAYGAGAEPNKRPKRRFNMHLNKTRRLAAHLEEPHMQSQSGCARSNGNNGQPYSWEGEHNAWQSLMKEQQSGLHRPYLNS
ncbi:hypothetical protein SARC_09782 [Sphaeroforma arctica JP610]|uniref:Cyclin N-terminal domain-containing protein n=1 Tax=Sphaeroforma arctica JP610 TaxID=667725 RepID=A0A0L0FLW1_9EUKA|nr:hypothetical protein SARC_09782 [Sphaeroforma arctica JP610]KNC77767.1 hypothetical protein SARC_09782 [Sphaeroforma arctica JP610]|eukprot:XP_014151669.1 hypothetical protein SARC_09782 [Sphaeroforma arctica JP610]